MKIQNNYNLSKLNTFGIPASAKFFIEIHTEADLKELFDTPEFKNVKKIFLGGGSNALLTKDFNGLVILNKLKGIEILDAPSEVGKDFVFIRAMGGGIWHDLVVFATERGLWGIENLSLIPGTVGAAPMQNIGAYGAELKDTLLNVETFETETGIKRIFNREECELGYRDSIFKNRLKDKYFISAITLKLSRKEHKNLTYRALSLYLEKNKIEVKKSKDISDAVSLIRKNKLPDPADIPNAGSFFKNVFMSKDKFDILAKIYTDVPYFVEPSDVSTLAGQDSAIKIPAGWLIEQCGWKGKRVGNVGVHEKQALVLVNYGGASGEEIKNLADQITVSVFLKFGLKLVPEVNLV